MAQIQCTQKLLKELKVKPVEIQENLSPLSSWHANLLTFDRRKCVLISNNKTLYSILIEGLTKPDFNHFNDILGQAVFKNLLQENLPQEQIEILLEEFQQVTYTKTNSRSILGSMNDLAFQLKVMISMDGGLNNINIYDVNKKLNRTRLSYIDGYAIDGLKNSLNNQ